MKPEVSERHKTLLDELDTASQLQGEALERAIDLKLTDEEVVEFFQRAARIQEIGEILGALKSRYGAV